MGGFIAPSTKIGGTEVSPGIPLASTPFSGLHQTDSGGIGITLAGEDHSLLDAAGWELGRLVEPDYVVGEVAGSPFAVGGTTLIPGIDNGEKFIAVPLNSTHSVSIFLRNSLTGALTLAAGSPLVLDATINPTECAFSPDGKFLAVAGSYLSGTKKVYVFSVSANGALTAVPGSPYTITGSSSTGARRVAYSDNGKFLGFTGKEHIFMYLVNPSTGALTPVTGSPYNSFPIADTLAIKFSRDSKHLLVSDAFSPGKIAVYDVDDGTGVLTPVSGSPFTVSGTGVISLNFSPDGQFIIGSIPNDAGSTIWRFDNATGNISGVSSIFGTKPKYSVFSPDGKHIAVVGDAASDYMGLYNFDAASGATSPVPGSPFLFGAGWLPLSIVFSPDNFFIYAAMNPGFLRIFSTSSTGPKFKLIDATFDADGGTDGSVNVNGALRVFGNDVPDMSDNDARYAKLAGLSTQVFDVAAGAGTQAVNKTQADATYAKLAGLSTQVFAAKGFKGSEAVNAAQGIATLVAGTVTVSNTSITANSRILISAQETGALTGILRVSARSVGVSFTISSSVNTDTATVCYEIFEPA